jgi:hypothetical protein
MGVVTVKTHIPTDLDEDGDVPELERHHPGYKFVQTSTETGMREPLAEFAAGGLIIGNGTVALFWGCVR